MKGRALVIESRQKNRKNIFQVFALEYPARNPRRIKYAILNATFPTRRQAIEHGRKAAGKLEKMYPNFRFLTRELR